MSEDKEGSLLFTAASMFDPGRSVKVFTVSSPRVTGDRFHRHDYMQIFYVLRGVCHHYIGGQCYDLARGDGFVMPPNLIHKTELAADSEIFCCEFLPSAASPHAPPYAPLLEQARIELSFLSFLLADQAGVKPRVSFAPEEMIHMEYLTRQMLREYDSHQRYARELLGLYVQEMIIAYAREYDLIARENETDEVARRYRFALQKALAYIDEHYAEPLSLEDVCRVAAIGKTNFCYLFKLTTSKTFVKYLSDVRVGHAMELLETTNLSVTRICYEVGFKNLSHFARVFLNTTGLSAKAYRAERRMT